MDNYFHRSIKSVLQLIASSRTRSILIIGSQWRFQAPLSYFLVFDSDEMKLPRLESAIKPSRSGNYDVTPVGLWRWIRRSTSISLNNNVRAWTEGFIKTPIVWFGYDIQIQNNSEITSKLTALNKTLSGMVVLYLLIWVEVTLVNISYVITYHLSVTHCPLSWLSTSERYPFLLLVEGETNLRRSV